MVMLPNFPGGKLALVEPAALLAESRYQDKSYTVSKLSGASPRKLPDMIVTRLRDVDQNRAIFAFLMGGCHFVNMVKQNGVRTLLKILSCNLNHSVLDRKSADNTRLLQGRVNVCGK